MLEFKWAEGHLYLEIVTGQGISEVYLQPRQTSRVELFAKIVDGWKLLTMFAKKLYLRYLTYF